MFWQRTGVIAIVLLTGTLQVNGVQRAQAGHACMPLNQLATVARILNFTSEELEILPDLCIPNYTELRNTAFPDLHDGIPDGVECEPIKWYAHPIDRNFFQSHRLQVW